MARLFRGGRATKIAVSSATVAALLLSCSGNLGVSKASVKLSHSSRLGGANVFVNPQVSKTLWVKTMDPGAVTDVTSAAIEGLVFNGLLKQSYNDKTKKFTIVPDLAAALPAVSKGGLVY